MRRRAGSECEVKAYSREPVCGTKWRDGDVLCMFRVNEVVPLNFQLMVNREAGGADGGGWADSDRAR